MINKSITVTADHTSFSSASRSTSGKLSKNVLQVSPSSLKLIHTWKGLFRILTRLTQCLHFCFPTSIRLNVQSCVHLWVLIIQWRALPWGSGGIGRLWTSHPCWKSCHSTKRECHWMSCHSWHNNTCTWYSSRPKSKINTSEESSDFLDKPTSFTVIAFCTARINSCNQQPAFTLTPWKWNSLGLYSSGFTCLNPVSALKRNTRLPWQPCDCIV